jgi:hypothetical protein
MHAVCSLMVFAISAVEYAGGTQPEIAAGAQGRIDLSDQRYMAFYVKKSGVRIAYDRINVLEYGQNVSRRLAEAIVISPMFLLAKKRKHFLTIGYRDEQNIQQALVFRVGKNDIRALLASLEARTGRKVEYQDLEARKSGKGE